MHLCNLGGGDGTPIKLLLRIGPREGVESPSSGGVQEMWRCDSKEHGLLDMVVVR